MAPQNPTPAAHLETRDLGPLIWKVSSVLWVGPHCPEAPCVCLCLGLPSILVPQAAWDWDLYLPASISPLLWLPAPALPAKPVLFLAECPAPRVNPRRFQRKKMVPHVLCVV